MIERIPEVVSVEVRYDNCFTNCNITLKSMIAISVYGLVNIKN